MNVNFVEAEVALRKKIFLQGVEIGKGRPLTAVLVVAYAV
jgi:hypothetical protein